MIRVGTAGWGLRAAEGVQFPATGSHLERYAAVFGAVEINSSFYRPHRGSTYARWARSVPADFRFAVKIPKAITHERRLVRCAQLLDEFMAPVLELGEKLGCLLVQLPPKLAFEAAPAGRFLRAMRERHGGAIALEARHPSWFEARAEALLDANRIARVAADPPRAPADGVPGGWRDLAYYRLHGSPRMYHSAYEPSWLASLAERVAGDARHDRDAWCIFDNTASRAAIGDALYIQGKLKDPVTARYSSPMQRPGNPGEGSS